MLTIISGGELTAIAATKTVSKFSHVKVSKHTVSGKTTKYARVKLTNLKHGEKASTKTDKHGKFVLKVKKNNLTKLKFKLKATKKGYKMRAYTHPFKHSSQPIGNGGITESSNQSPVAVPKKQNSSTVATHLSSNSQSATTSTQDKTKQVKELRVEIENAIQNYIILKQKLKPQIDNYNSLFSERSKLNNNLAIARNRLLSAKESLTTSDVSSTTDIQAANQKVSVAQATFDKAYSDYYGYMDKCSNQFIEGARAHNQLSAAEQKVTDLGNELEKLEPGMPNEGTLDFE
ncbi:carboxypeptidase-like regulatory domain-containing protein [Levilactobacillus fuyuanensis]|uniref:Carboxypeptidase-like regulatory domain-containing protein n=1 Tax=Levilactobacillus fuyuanensis TaxID=2486022 RepID=A0ABW4H292_9LACO|nr:hypothetical protein [Levilactobacillus fuyuanensis]